MTVICGVSAVLADHRYPQATLTAALAARLLPAGLPDPALLHRLHERTGVAHRCLALPLPAYAELADFGAANDAWIEVAGDLGQRALTAALVQSGLPATAVDHLVTTTVTGVSTPSLDTHLIASTGLRREVRRLPLFGLGCVGGAAGLARLADLLRGDPDGVGVLLAVELCSLTVQVDDVSVANLVATGLFGDGAAAVVMCGERRAAELGIAGPRVRASTAALYPGTERAMGWDVGPSGLRVVLSAQVPAIVAEQLGPDVRGFLAQHGLSTRAIAHWIAHPGGPRVIDAVHTALDLPPAALARTRRSLRDNGNLSSASVLHILADTLEAEPAGTSEPALLFAMGPGFCSELVLLQW